jgi:hypothetical protein
MTDRPQTATAAGQLAPPIQIMPTVAAQTQKAMRLTVSNLLFPPGSLVDIAAPFARAREWPAALRDFNPKCGGGAETDAGGGVFSFSDERCHEKRRGAVLESDEASCPAKQSPLADQDDDDQIDKYGTDNRFPKSLM